MSTEYTQIFGEIVERVAERLNVSLPSRFRLLPEPKEMLDAIADAIEIEFDDWERVYDIAVEDAEKWQTKYIQCRDQRHRLFRILRLSLMHGVITGGDISDLLKMMELLCGSDVSSVERSSPES